MTKNPLINALAAAAYIVAISLLMNWGTKMAPKGPDTFMAPVAVISLFTLSAAMMGYIFCYRPLLMIIEGKTKQALHLFLTTTVIFGVITSGALFALFTGVIR